MARKGHTFFFIIIIIIIIIIFIIIIIITITDTPVDPEAGHWGVGVARAAGAGEGRSPGRHHPAAGRAASVRWLRHLQPRTSTNNGFYFLYYLKDVGLSVFLSFPE